MTRLDPEWALRVGPPGFELSHTRPLFAAAYETPAEPSLQIDLHEGLEVGLVLAGQLEFQFEGMVMRLGPGEAWLCPVWEPHGWRNLNAGATVVLVFLPGFLGDEPFGAISWLEPFMVPPGDRHRATSAELRQTLLAVGSDLRHEISCRPRFWTEAVRLGVLRILLLLAREWQIPTRAHPRQAVRVGDLGQVTPALRLLRASLARPLSRLQAAQACGLSESRFSTLFRRALGMSFGLYRRRVKLASAAHLLLTTDLSLESTASETGFANASHLHRAFVKDYHCTPGEYRRGARP